MFEDIDKKKETIIKVYPKQLDSIAYTIHYSMRISDDTNTVVKESKLRLWLRSQKNSGV